MWIGLQLPCAAVNGTTGFQVVAVGGYLQFIDVSTIVLVETVVLTLGDGKRA